MTNKHKSSYAISKQLLQRLPLYLNFLKNYADKDGYVSAPMIASAMRLNEVQVRKDLAAVSSTGGKPKTGFATEQLIRDIEKFLGYDNVDEAVIAGAGRLGSALLAYSRFSEYGLKILMGFESDEKLIGTEIAGKQILSIDKLPDVCKRLNIHIGIITVPAESAQEICDKMIAGGIQAIWNFAPIHLNVPDHVLVQNQDMAASLAILSKHLREKLEKKEEV
ncbi:MAG: redox-sensing transcriptional repressor Rex [Bacillota bacterium]|nr:redox-sensing transcriptional repressor Rex [Bacillota bacterium]NLM08751.1 redox-sensing transcriptional repressor Rex [Clostridiales Family XIII bacterium]